MNTTVEKYEVSGSSTIRQADYDHLLGSLTIHFNSGGVYQYVGVKRQVFVDLQEAESAGRYFHANVKGKYDFLKKNTP